MPKTDEMKDNVVASGLNPGGKEGGATGAAIENAPALADREQAENWLKALFTGLVNLKIETVITENPNQAAQSIQTTINLIEGDIRTEIHKSLAKDLDVFDFHKEQVKKGEDIIKTNVETVKTLAEGLLDLFTG